MYINLIEYGKKLESMPQTPAVLEQIHNCKLELIRWAFAEAEMSEGKVIDIMQDFFTAEEVLEATDIETAKKFANWRVFKCI